MRKAKLLFFLGITLRNDNNLAKIVLNKVESN